MYKVSSHVTTSPPSFATLEQILRGDAFPQPTRRQRFDLALILASSFLQFLHSSWLPIPFGKADVFFKSDPNHSALFKLDQPHIRQQFDGCGKARLSTTDMAAASVSDSLDQLGIILLELCFGRLLEDQSYRKGWPKGRNAKEAAGYDVMAARDWQCQIRDEAGFDYAEAVGWCLGGNRSTPRDRWREEMFLRVIQGLQRSRDYLTVAVVP